MILEQYCAQREVLTTEIQICELTAWVWYFYHGNGWNLQVLCAKKAGEAEEEPRETQIKEAEREGRVGQEEWKINNQYEGRNQGQRAF